MAGRHEAPEIVVVLEDVCGCMSPCVAEQFHRLYALTHRLEHRLMAQQDDINAITSELHDGLGRIQDEITNLENAQANGQPLDLSALKAEADAVANVVPAPAPVPDQPTDGGDGSAPVDPNVPVVDPNAPSV